MSYDMQIKSEEQKIESERDMSENEQLRPIEELSFREAMAELDAIVAKLEGNTLELEESLEAYERGIALLRSLRGRLSHAQQQVVQLMGVLEEAPSDEELESSLNKA
jgi:exodeoxyribonuclease VII small subunit